MMKLMSSSVARGDMVMSAGASVVPASVEPSHGSKKSTRPSLVLGTMRPMRSGEKWSGRITCTPAAPRMSGGVAGSSSARSASPKGPVAFTTAFARTLKARPVCSSRTATPAAAPRASLSTPVTDT